MIGRALDKAGRPVADTLRQENYIEDRFNIAVQTQEKLAKTLANSGPGRVTLPLELTRQWVKQAYMGVLDVQPLDNIGNSGQLKKCDFGATRVGTGKGPSLLHVEGESEVFIDEKMANAGPGDMHEIKLKWHGFIEMEENRMTRLVLSAIGKEKLKFNSARGKDDNEVALLPGGHRIDMSCGVRFGILGEPVGPDKVSADAPDMPPLERSDPVDHQIMQALGSSSLVFHPKVQEELKLSDEQKRKLQKRLQGTIQNAKQTFQRIGDKPPDEREKALCATSRKSRIT